MLRQWQEKSYRDRVTLNVLIKLSSEMKEIEEGWIFDSDFDSVSDKLKNKGKSSKS
jgi:hypothetical protein